MILNPFGILLAKGLLHVGFVFDSCAIDYATLCRFIANPEGIDLIVVSVSHAHGYDAGGKVSPVIVL